MDLEEKNKTSSWIDTETKINNFWVSFYNLHCVCV